MSPYDAPHDSAAECPRWQMNTCPCLSEAQWRIFLARQAREVEARMAALRALEAS